MKPPIYVTKPYLPPLAELTPYLEEIWNNNVLTNGGPFHRQLEHELCEYLDVAHISLFSNGTLALITALQALQVKGQVITTPFSFVATSHSLLWNRLEPIFVDIDKETMNINPKNIENAITDRTTAILPVHCYGIPCNVDEIQEIAEKHNLKVIYDAAHAFGVNCHCGSILNHGDLSILSFHATKVFNTFEGGAIICKDKQTKDFIDHLKNFGFDNEISVSCNGINAKMNEFQAAVGLLQLRHINDAIDARKAVAKNYMELLSDVPGIRCVSINTAWKANYSYFPILVEESYGRSRDSLYELLKNERIFARRYFYPLISDFPMYRHYATSSPGNLPVAREISEKILCLPIYPSLELSDQMRIIQAIRDGHI